MTLSPKPTIATGIPAWQWFAIAAFLLVLQAALLYGMAYVPTPCETARNFTNNLNSTVTGAKNTARWTLQLPTTAFRDQLFRKLKARFSLDGGPSV